MGLLGLINKLILKLPHWIMYPELKKAGGLANALNLELSKFNSALQVAVSDDSRIMPVTYVRVEKGNKFSQVYIGANEKLYLPDFWRNGVCLAHAKTKSLKKLAELIDFWLVQDVSTETLAQQYDIVQPTEKAKAFDENREVEYTWKQILLDESKTELYEFVSLAIHDDILSTLFPFTSLYTLCFSRCTGYPYHTEDLPKITPKLTEYFSVQNYNKADREKSAEQSLETLFVVTKNYNEFIGEGNAAEVLKIVKDNLPDNIGPATKGTAKD